MRKILTLIAALSLVASLAVGGSIAYLQDADQAVNTMTLGNVDIEQHEYERKVGADGKYVTDTIDKQTSYVLKDFTQAKPLYPAIIPNGGSFNGITWNYDSIPVRMSQVDSYGGASVFNTPNAVDKFVTVENTGKSDAYVRTLVAFEVGTATLTDENYPNEPLISSEIRATTAESNTNGAFPWTYGFSDYVEIDGNKYLVYELIYTGAKLSDGSWRHANGVLPAGDTTYPNLCQVYMASRATNEDVKALDGNGNGTYDILVVSQAVQAAGFADAKTALDTAFGPVSATSHPWKDWDGKTDAEGDQDPDRFVFVDTLDELKEAFAKGGDIKLTDDIKLDKITSIEPGTEVYLDLNGNTITVDQNSTSNTLFYVKDGAKLVIDGDGTIDLEDLSTMAIFAPYGELVIENGTFIRNEVTTVTNKTTGLFMGAKTVASNVTINGGYFDPGYYDTNAADIEEILDGTKEFTETADDIAKRGQSGDKNLFRTAVKDNVSVVLNHSGYGSFKVYGGTFVGANPAWGDEGCMLPTTPNYLRPWSYYQGALLAGQTYNENGLVIPNGYTITKEMNSKNVPVYTVNYNK